MDVPIPFPDDLTFVTPAAVRLRAGREIDPNLFTRWQREGRVEKLRNGLYLNAETRLRGPADHFLVANRLYGPSYVSLHAALHYWGLIPEAVFEMTSVSTRKTATFRAGGVRYSYRQIAPSLLFGYDVAEWRGGLLHVAHAEKALIDYAYFHPGMDDPEYVYEMRFDESVLAELDWGRMERYLNWAGSPVLTRRIGLLRTTELA